jgi:midasin (ATPase involved in ribosome maturation)
MEADLKINNKNKEKKKRKKKEFPSFYVLCRLCEIKCIHKIKQKQYQSIKTQQVNVALVNLGETYFSKLAAGMDCRNSIK